MGMTKSAKLGEIKQDWYEVDADGKVLGRLATMVAARLRGKHKAEFTPHMDTGDYIIVKNTDKIIVTGKKETDKIYYKHTHFPGGIKEITLGKQRIKDSTAIIKKAVKGMLPPGPLGRAMLKKLKLYTGLEHPHSAQQPKQLTLAKAERKVPQAA